MLNTSLSAANDIDPQKTWADTEDLEIHFFFVLCSWRRSPWPRSCAGQGWAARRLALWSLRARASARLERLLAMMQSEPDEFDEYTDERIPMQLQLPAMAMAFIPIG